MDTSAALRTSAPGWPRLRWLTLGVVVLTSFLGTWDGSAPAVALPAITRVYGVGIDSAVWVVAINNLMFAVPMAVFGKLGDMFGHKRMYVVSALLLAVFAALSALAPSFGLLIVCRALQGLASAPTFTATMALIATTFPAGERGRAMGVMSTAASLGWAAGPPLGGLLLRAFPWQAIILVEIPVALAAALLAWRLMPGDAQRSRPEFDLLGAASLTGAMLALMLGVRQLGQGGLASAPTLLTAAAFAGLLGLFLVSQRLHPRPFLPLALFANARFSAATVFSAAQALAMFAMLLLMSVYLQEVGGLDAAAAGALVAGLSLARIVCEPITGRVAELRGARLPGLLGAGLVFLVAGGFALWLTPHVPRWLLFLGMFVFGIGISLGRTPVNAAVTHLVPRERLGLALGVFSMITYTCGTLGQAFFGVFLRLLTGVGDAPLAAAPGPVLLRAFSLCLAVVTAVAGVAFVFGLRLPGRPEMVSDGPVLA
jgi:MFS family permease